MGLRDKLNDNPKLTMIGTTVIIVGVLGYVIYASTRGGIGGMVIQTEAFYTADDGQTWFKDDIKKVPPFDHGGKQAYGAVVYTCGGKTFVNHMIRYTADSKKKMEAAQAANPPNLKILEQIDNAGKEIKAPGQKDWVRTRDQMKSRPIMQPKCNGADFEQVVP